MKPQRIQLRRTKGFNLQTESRALNGLDAAKVSRPGPFGNPYKVGADFKMPNHEAVKITTEGAIRLYQIWLKNRLSENPNFLRPLHGKNLACFCRLGDPCHADILLEAIGKHDQARTNTL